MEIRLIRGGELPAAMDLFCPAFHRQGIGRLLFQAYLAEGGWGRVTVHSSPYAVEVYRQLGFFPTAEEQLSPDGIRYTPMVWEQT